MQFSNKTYDVLKQIALIWLPATGTLYFALASIWNLPLGQEIVGTITAVDAFLGVVLGISTQQYNANGYNFDGAFVVNTTNPMKDTYTLDISTPLHEIPEKDSLQLQVKDESSQ